MSFLFELHIKNGLYWTDMEQSHFHPTNLMQSSKTKFRQSALNNFENIARDGWTHISSSGEF